MLETWLTIVAVTIGALLPIANPFSAAPVFIAVTRGMTGARRRQQGRLAAIYMACVLIASLLAGVVILEFFGVSLPALRIAGGLVIARLGFGMLNPEPVSELPEDQQQEAMGMSDIAFTPIAMPLLVGVGVQFIGNGFIELITDDSVVQMIYEAYPLEPPVFDESVKGSTTILPAEVDGKLVEDPALSNGTQE